MFKYKFSHHSVSASGIHILFSFSPTHKKFPPNVLWEQGLSLATAAAIAVKLNCRYDCTKKKEVKKKMKKYCCSSKRSPISTEGEKGRRRREG